MLAVGRRERVESVDPVVCEAEPIQVPGTIQPPSGLLAVDPATFIVEAASETMAELIGTDSAILGCTLDEVLSPEAATMIRTAYGDGTLPEGPPIRRPATLGPERRPFDLMLHHKDGRLIVEVEAAPRLPGDFGVPPHAAIREAVEALRKADDLAGLLDAAVARIKDLSGYERVLIYRFDSDWNGEAVAEAIDPDWDASLKGLHFPASDIPRQARELYTRSPSRFVVDRDAAPVPIVARPTMGNRPIDMTFAGFRSLSPVHLEYQRNLGVNGSMSIAILVDGQLWGLVIGHHRRPLYQAPETRDALVGFTDTLALAIEETAARTKAADQNVHLFAEVALLEQMAGADDIAVALSGETRLNDLFGSTGAAVITGDAVSTIGSTPPESDIVDLIRRARDEIEALAFGTDHLESFHPAMADHRAIASGALIAFTSESRHRALVWFRPEIVRTIAWGGDPSKPLAGDRMSGQALPRASFERWVETVRGRSRPWPDWKVEAAQALARAVERMGARTTRRIEELSRQQADLIAALVQKEALLAEKDLMTREIDHRVKNSLQIVSAFLRMQGRQVSDPDARAAFNDSYGRVMSIARVHDSLYQSDSVTEVDLGQTIENLCRDLAVMGGDRREIGLDVQQGLMVPYRKAVALCLIATELVTNAWKYAYPANQPGPVEVEVKRSTSDGLSLTVRDLGKGMPTDWEENRKGLGMQIIGAMLSQIEASIAVVNDPGARVTVTCT